MNLDQEKRVMLAFALSIVMLVLYRVYFIKEQPPSRRRPPGGGHYSCWPAGSAQGDDHRAAATAAKPPLPQHYRYCKAPSPKTSWWKASSTA